MHGEYLHRQLPLLSVQEPSASSHFLHKQKVLIAYHFDLALLYSLIKIHSLHIQLRNAPAFLCNGIHLIRNLPLLIVDTL